MPDRELGKYMTARELHLPTIRKTRVFDVLNKSGGYVLGRVAWYGAWRCYTFSPVSPTAFDESCLTAIVCFLSELNHERRQAVKGGVSDAAR